MKVKFFCPIDQFENRHRLIDELRSGFLAKEYDICRIAVAFAKSGPILRLLPSIQAFRRRGGQVLTIFGVDLKATSREALELALEHFDETYITHTEASPIFHPKFYLFSGANSAFCLHGSHNLTVGGTETNLEGGVRVDFQLPSDQASHREALGCWETLKPPKCTFTKRLDARLLSGLISEGYVLDEATSRKLANSTMGKTAKSRGGLFPSIPPKPPSPIPPVVHPNGKQAGSPSKGPANLPAPGAVARTAIQALVIQIVPHSNGEIHLSTNAVKQNPKFFGMPFTGSTTPKQAKNKAYPQRIPDPRVDIEVYDASGKVVVADYGFNLNTVLYDKKSEIRVTVPPKVRQATSNLSILVMAEGSGGVDYNMKIYNPGSADYANYLAVCNQTLPSGGAANARKMGWL